MCEPQEHDLREAFQATKEAADLLATKIKKNQYLTIAKNILIGMVSFYVFVMCVHIAVLYTYGFCYREYCPSGEYQSWYTKCTDPYEIPPANKDGTCSDGIAPKQVYLCTAVDVRNQIQTYCFLKHFVFSVLFYGFSIPAIRAWTVMVLERQEELEKMA
jgi:hypothetical protein